MSKETQDGYKYKEAVAPKKIGKTNKANKIVRIEYYKELSFNAVLTEIRKTERREKRREERRAKR